MNVLAAFSNYLTFLFIISFNSGQRKLSKNSVMIYTQEKFKLFIQLCHLKNCVHPTTMVGIEEQTSAKFVMSTRCRAHQLNKAKLLFCIISIQLGELIWRREQQEEKEKARETWRQVQ